MGYPYNKKGWKVFALDTKNIFVSRDVQFFEDEFPFASPTIEITPTSTQSTSTPMSLYELSDASTPSLDVAPQPDPESVDRGSSSDSPSPPSMPIRRTSRPHRPPAHLKDYYCRTVTTPSSTNTLSNVPSGMLYPIENYVTNHIFSSQHQKFLATVSSTIKPRLFKEAMKDPLWQQAMRLEIQALEDNHTWVVTPLPPGKKAIPCKWIFRIKYHSDGFIERYKARLVIAGNNQIEGEDYNETFAPVAKMVSVRTFLSMAVAKGWDIYQLDVHNAFLHGDLEEEVYMRFPPGFSTGSPGSACKLNRSLYNLKQSPRNWFAKLRDSLLNFGFHQSKADYTLFTFTRDHEFIVVFIYVDDILLAGNNTSTCDQVKRHLQSWFKIKDLGKLKYFLGIEFARSSSGLFLSQRKFAMDILSECGLLGCKPADFPMDPNHKLALADGPAYEDPTRYRRLVGRLVYLTITRPELSYAVHTLYQFLQRPLQEHYDSVLRVLRYIKGNPGQGLLLSSTCDLQLRAYCDSDWASCPITRRSITGYFITLGKSPVLWKSKKQHTVSRSSAEAKYRSMAAATSELLWIKALLQDLGVSHLTPMQLYCDSQSAIHIASNSVFHEHTKHIELDCHFVREHVMAKTISTKHIRTSSQPADLLTKALSKKQFDFLLSKLGISSLHAPP